MRHVTTLQPYLYCAVARSPEAKALGVPMGAPWFKIRHLERSAGLIALSSNYTLYADMSHRMMTLIGQYSPDQEIYSIDESFLAFTGFEHWNLERHAQRLRRHIRQWIGIPVCVGIGPTKTLAKLANHYAKKRPRFNGVCHLGRLSSDALAALYDETPVDEVWGVGRRLTQHLAGYGIQSVADLKAASLSTLRQRFGVVMERTIRELRGTACYGLEDTAVPKQQIIASWSFGQLISELPGLEAAVASHTARAAEKLRRQGSVAGSIQVFIHTNPFRPNEPQHHPACLIPLKPTSADTSRLTRAALAGLRQLYRPGYRYQKAGVMLGELSPANEQQLELFEAVSASPADRAPLDQLIDILNARFGRGRIRRASEGYRGDWAMKRERLTRAYTTNWKGLAEVFA